MKRIIFVFLCAALLTSCADNNADNSSVSDVFETTTAAVSTQLTTEPVTATVTTTQPNIELSTDPNIKYTFSSAEEVMAMSDEQLAEIARSDIDYTGRGNIDLFDEPLVQLSEYQTENIALRIPTIDYADDLDGFIDQFLDSLTDGHENEGKNVDNGDTIVGYRDV